MKIIKIILLLLFLQACAIDHHEHKQVNVGLFELGAPFTDNMVLQQNADASIFGTGVVNTTVMIMASWGESAQAQVDERGKWLTHLKTPKAGGPYQITLSSQNTIKLNDVLIGEVWLASGQSNMEWSLNKTNEFDETLNGLSCGNIRLFTLKRNPQITPADSADATWEKCNPQTLAKFSAVSFHFAKKLNEKLKVPVGIMNSSFGGTEIAPWTPLAILNSDPKSIAAFTNKAKQVVDKHNSLEAGKASQNDIHRNLRRGPSFLYNGMIYPLVPYTLSGFLWYQGETNRFDGKHYGPMFRRLINAWRQEWRNAHGVKEGNENLILPFYFVQLAPYAYSNLPNRGVKTPLLLPIVRDAQASVLDMPNTGMAVITDHGDPKDIHPRKKKPVGYRLANLALRHTYQFDVLANSPQVDNIEYLGDKVHLSFNYAEGLKASDNEVLTWFELAGKDKQFYSAKAKIIENKVVVFSPDVKEPIAIRFAWHELANPNLVNSAGLPAIGFRSDNWPISDLPKRAH